MLALCKGTQAFSSLELVTLFVSTNYEGPPITYFLDLTFDHFLSTLFSDTRSLRCSRNVEDQVSNSQNNILKTGEPKK